MTEKIPARFRKTKTDKWAVMAPVEDLEKALADGGKIEVQRRSGDWSTFVVASLGRPFEVDGVQMCYGYAPGDDAGINDAGPAGSGGGAGSSTGPGSGSGSGGPGSRGSGARGGPRPSRPAPEPPPVDTSEPLPDYQGGSEDEWSGDY